MDLKSSWRFPFNNNIILKLRNALSSQHILCTSDNNDLTTTLGISLGKSWSSPSTNPHRRAQGPRQEKRMLGSSRHKLPAGPARPEGLLLPRHPSSQVCSFAGESTEENPAVHHLGLNGSKHLLVFCSPGSLALEKPSLAKLAC